MRYFSLLGFRLFAFFFLGMAAGCSSDSGNSGQVSEGTVVRSGLARNTSPQVSDADLAAVVAGNTEFALNVFPLLDPTLSNNVFFSPYSITQAFALLTPGAR